MEIKNKEAAKAFLRVKIQKNIKQFIFYFYGNIIINIIIITVVFATVGIGAFSLVTLQMPHLLVYGAFFTFFLSGVLSITIRNFFKNIRILNALRASHCELDIEDYELDHALDFIEHLPMSKEEVERVKVSLSFGKLIDVLDLFGMVNCKGEVYDLGIIFRYEIEEALEKNKVRKFIC